MVNYNPYTWVKKRYSSVTFSSKCDKVARQDHDRVTRLELQRPAPPREWGQLGLPGSSKRAVC